jgi:hypothetical protein
VLEENTSQHRAIASANHEERPRESAYLLNAVRPADENDMQHVSLPVSLAILLSACGGAVGPASPTPPGPPPVTLPTSSLSGTVSEMTATGLLPVEGVLVQEGDTQKRATTDRDGFYSITGLYDTSSALSAGNAISSSKPGYLDQIRNLKITGDTRLDIQLERYRMFILSGVVFEVTPAGEIPIEGVGIYSDGCGEGGHGGGYTDTTGSYSFPCFAGHQDLQVGKVGYRSPHTTGNFGLGVLITGDTTLNIQLVRQ